MIDVYSLLMIEFLNIESAFEHYKRVLGVTAPLRRVLNIMATACTWSTTTLIPASLLSVVSLKKLPAAVRTLSLACCQSHHDTGASEPTYRFVPSVTNSREGPAV